MRLNESEHAASEVVLRGVGRIALIASPRGLIRVEFLATSSPQVRSHGSGAAASIRDRAAEELQAYPSGGALTCPVDLVGVTAFQRRVLGELRRIGRGQAVAYGDIAHRLGKPGGARAVGGACGSNPVPLWVPCHRVLASNGRLGGFSGGLPVKRALLALEGIAFQG